MLILLLELSNEARVTLVLGVQCTVCRYLYLYININKDPKSSVTQKGCIGIRKQALQYEMLNNKILQKCVFSCPCPVMALPPV